MDGLVFANEVLRIYSAFHHVSVLAVVPFVVFGHKLHSRLLKLFGIQLAADRKLFKVELLALALVYNTYELVVLIWKVDRVGLVRKVAELVHWVATERSQGLRVKTTHLMCSHI